MSKINLYQGLDFGGKLVPFGSAVENLKNYDFNDTASSCEVIESTWLLYSGADFHDNESSLAPGKYPNPTSMGLSDKSLSSLRPLPDAQKGVPAIALFQNADYCGRMKVLNSPLDNFKSIDFNDSVSSIIVISGKWELFQDADYLGTKWTLTADGGPKNNGWYPNPQYYFSNDSISSARPI